MDTQLPTPKLLKKEDAVRMRHNVPRGVFEVKVKENICANSEKEIHIVDKKVRKLNPSIQQRIQCVGNYDLGKTLGTGQFGKVKLAEHVLTGEKVAIKIITKTKLDTHALNMVKREISILKRLHHPNIIRLYEVIETEKFLFIITDYASGGEVLDYIVMHNKLSEDRARRFFRQIICALWHCHKLGIVHRDLKAENILLDENLNIKIIDFGFSNLYSPNHLLKTPCGSPNYAAPELIQQKHYIGPEVDIWSAGVVLYIFLVGVPPFQGPDLITVYKKVINCDYTIPEYFSSELVDLIQSIFVADREKRASLERIVNHPWVVGDDQWHCENYPSIPPKLSKDSIDPTLLLQLERFGFNKDSAISSILNNPYDPISATFRLLLDKKRKDTERDILKAIERVGLHSGMQSFISGIVSTPSSAATSPTSSTPTSPRSLSPRQLSIKLMANANENEGQAEKIKRTLSENFAIPVAPIQEVSSDVKAKERKSVGVHPSRVVNRSQSTTDDNPSDHIISRDENENNQAEIGNNFVNKNIYIPMNSNHKAVIEHFAIRDRISKMRKNNNSIDLGKNARDRQDQTSHNNDNDTTNNHIKIHNLSNQNITAPSLNELEEKKDESTEDKIKNDNNNNNNNNNVNLESKTIMNIKRRNRLSNHRRIASDTRSLENFAQKKKSPATKPLFTSILSSSDNKSIADKSEKENIKKVDSPGLVPHSPYVLTEIEMEELELDKLKLKEPSPPLPNNNSNINSNSNNSNSNSNNSNSNNNNNNNNNTKNQSAFASFLSWTKELMTRKKSIEDNNPDLPRQIRTVLKTTLTSNLQPDLIMEQIRKALNELQISYSSQHSFCVTAYSKMKNLTFEIEVCGLPNVSNMYVVRFGRVSGNWEEYKELCISIQGHLKL